MTEREKLVEQLEEGFRDFAAFALYAYFVRADAATALDLWRSPASEQARSDAEKHVAACAEAWQGPESRATPPDGPCVWVARDGGTFNRTKLYIGKAPVAERYREVPGNVLHIFYEAAEGERAGHLLPEDLAAALGLAPGACQRVRLVPIPEGET